MNGNVDRYTDLERNGRIYANSDDIIDGLIKLIGKQNEWLAAVDE